MEVIVILLIILAVSYLVETQAEFLFTDLVDMALAWIPFKVEETRKKIKTMLMKIIVVGIAISLSFFYQFDFLYLLARFAGTEWEPLSAVHWPGIILTGVGIGMGSVYLHGFIQKYFIKPGAVEELPNS